MSSVAVGSRALLNSQTQLSKCIPEMWAGGRTDGFGATAGENVYRKIASREYMMLRSMVSLRNQSFLYVCVDILWIV